ncbi:Protein SRC2-like [Vitis vinifera]|uniref:Protein SRC2-like n=1 Tax=Vitis vinifera TaxID=29760 RepID=A0A438F3I6_VITVI|nr:Protein SRC2-like [Vitis vinifera]
MLRLTSSIIGGNLAFCKGDQKGQTNLQDGCVCGGHRLWRSSEPPERRCIRTVDPTQSDHLMLILQLRCFRHLHADVDIGEVDVPVKGLLDHAGDDMSAKYVTYDVKRPSGKPKGKLNFSFKFGERVAGATQSPVTAYPMHTVYCAPYVSPAAVPHPATVMGCYPPAGYPPAGFPDTSYGYHPNFDSSPPRPPPGYPPIGSENGYSPVKPEVPEQQPTKTDDNSLEMLAAALATILMGDEVSDAPELSHDHGPVHN